MPKKIQAKYKQNSDHSITVLNVPTKEGSLDVTLRPVEYDDEQLFVQKKDDPLINYKFVSSLVTKWGDKEGTEIDGNRVSPVTSLELKANGRAMKILDSVIDQCFLTVVELVDITEEGVA